MPKDLKSPPIRDELDRNAIRDTTSPARKVVTRSPHRSVGIVACSWIQDRGIEYESQLERRFLQRALLFPSLKMIVHQPFKIDYLDEEEQREYTPDFLVVFHDDTRLVVEVKPAVFVKRHRIKLSGATRILEAEGILFLVVTDREIDTGIAAYNAGLLLRYARGSILEIDRQRCLGVAISADGIPTTIGVLMKRANISLVDILHLISRGHLHIPLDVAIDHKTPITVTSKDEKNAPLRFCDWLNTTPWSAAS